MGVNSLPKTVTRQRRACDSWTQALLRMSPSWVRFLVYNTSLVQYRWTGLLTADRLKMQEWNIVNSSKFSLSCCTYDFHRCRFVLAFSVLAFSTLAYSYLRIPYLHIPSPGTFVFRTCVFSRPTLCCVWFRSVVVNGLWLCRVQKTNFRSRGIKGSSTYCAWGASAGAKII